MVIGNFTFCSVIDLRLSVVTNFSVIPLSYCSQNLPLEVVYVLFGLDMQKALLGARSTRALAVTHIDAQSAEPPCPYPPPRFDGIEMESF